MRIWKLLMVAALFAVASAVWGSAVSAEDSSHTVIVPFDPSRPVKEQKPDSVFLDYPTFLRLWESAKKTRTDRGRGGAAEKLGVG